MGYICIYQGNNKSICNHIGEKNCNKSEFCAKASVFWFLSYWTLFLSRLLPSNHMYRANEREEDWIVGFIGQLIATICVRNHSFLALWLVTYLLDLNRISQFSYATVSYILRHKPVESLTMAPDFSLERSLDYYTAINYRGSFRNYHLPNEISYKSLDSLYLSCF